MKKLILTASCFLLIAGCFQQAQESYQSSPSYSGVHAPASSSGYENKSPGSQDRYKRIEGGGGALSSEHHPQVVKPAERKNHVKCQYKNSLGHRWTRGAFSADAACQQAQSACQSWESQNKRNPHGCMKVGSWRSSGN